VAVGVVLAPTPVPLGVVLAVLGLALLAHDSKLLRGLIRRLRARCPEASAKAHDLRHRLPALLRRVIERTDPRRRPRFRARRRHPVT